MISTYNSKEAENFWLLIKDTSREIKLWLINQLSASLIQQDLASDEEKKKTEKFISKYEGAWEGLESAEDIIQYIKSKPSIKEPPKFD